MTSDFEQRVSRTIAGHDLLRHEGTVLVALSGGADSVALLAVLTRLGYDCVAAHCNFRLRGDESIRDMRHAEAIARRLGVNIYVREFDVSARMKATGESVEMACRELRYAWFYDLLDRDLSQAVAVGHHREDNVETFLINLLRSSGIAGLTGMAYRRDAVVRPLLDVTRVEIEDYLKEQGLDYVEDSSNAGNEFRRNRLRNIIIPMLETHFPGASDSILSVISNLDDAHTLLKYTTDMAMGDIVSADNVINLEALVKRHGTGKASLLLYHYLKDQGFNRTHTDNMIRSVVQGNSGLKFEAHHRTAELDRGVLTLSKPSGNQRHSEDSGPGPFQVDLRRDILTPINIHITHHHVTEFRPSRNPDIMYLDSSVLEGDPVFELRHVQRGDRFRPYGLHGQKLVSDLLKDFKLSAWQKRNVMVLTRNSEIIWVVGLRASDLFTVTPATRNFVRLELKH